MYILLHKKIKGKPYSVRHYRGFPKLFLENQALLGFHEAKTGVECGSWARRSSWACNPAWSEAVRLARRQCFPVWPRKRTSDLRLRVHAHALWLCCFFLRSSLAL